MKTYRKIMIVATLLLGSFVLSGCVNDIPNDEVDSKHTSGILLYFTPPQRSEIEVSSRAYNLNDLDENRVRNVYVFIFDSSGDKVYSQYYDSSNHEPSASTVQNASKDCWHVANTSNTDSQHTTGLINLHTTVDAGDTYQIYAVTNLDADMVDVSSDRLSQVQTEAQLFEAKGRMIQQTTSRNGSLQMSGALTGVKIVDNGSGGANITKDGNTANLQLTHMDAKVHVTLKQGDAVMTLTNAEIKIVNLPKSGYIMPYEVRVAGADDTTAGYDAGNSAEDFFDYGFNAFDEMSQETTGGSTKSTYDAWFYMLESRRTPKSKIPALGGGANKFFERDRQVKDVSSGPNYGMNVVDGEGNRDFVYANNLAPYMLIKCSIAMELTDDDEGSELGGDVQYLIHLGDFGSDVDNYNTNRNTYYHYTITVNGVHNVRLEVDAANQLIDSNGRQPDENQPSASGNVTVAKEEIAICDCHYTTKTLTFHASNVEETMTWYVNTPFGEGQPEIDIEGNDIIPPGLDYKWCMFRVNKMVGGLYSEARQEYTVTPYHEVNKPDGLMNVSQLVKYI